MAFVNTAYVPSVRSLRRRRATEMSNAVVSRCAEVLPMDILEKISVAYQQRVAPRPTFTGCTGCAGYTELRTMEPKVVTKSWYGVNGRDLWTEVSHEFPFVHKERTFKLSVTFHPVAGCPVVFSMEEWIDAQRNIILNRGNAYVRSINGDQSSLRLSMFVGGTPDNTLLPPRILDSRETVKAVVGALCVVCERYNYNLLEWRLDWKYATRKQTYVHHLWKNV